MIKPFLLLQLRPEDEASDDEYRAFLKFGGLQPEDTVRVRMEHEGVPNMYLEDFSGIIIGGGPFNTSDPEEKKSAEQKRLEKELDVLLQKVIAADFPLLGNCYGIGVVTKHCGGNVSRKFSEDVGGINVVLTKEGEQDPLLTGLPKTFRALGGHKEACEVVPKGAVLLASSNTCPVQILRIRNNIYAIQFHTEADAVGINLRVKIYKHYGYFPPEEAKALMARIEKEDVTVPMMILRRFVEIHKKQLGV